mgnify:CR=1 FL=1
MFAAFFYLLRQRGLHVSLNEWMTLLEGMEKGLHHSTLTGFYHLCRAIVVKNETEFDRNSSRMSPTPGSCRRICWTG